VNPQRRNESTAMLYLFSASSASSRAAILWFRFPTVVPGGSSPIQPQAEGKGWLLRSATLLRISLLHCADSCFQDSSVTRPLLDVALCCSLLLSRLMSACKECRLPVSNIKTVAGVVRQQKGERGAGQREGGGLVYMVLLRLWQIHGIQACI